MRYLIPLGATLTLLLSPSLGEAQSRSTQNAVITANRYLGTPINTHDPRVNPYSSYGANNPYTTDGGRIYAQDGTYLGKLNSNPYDSESVANPYGRYGSPYSSTSINNRYSQYGSPYSSQSATNPYTVTPPVVRYSVPQSSTYKPPCYYNCD